MTVKSFNPESLFGSAEGFSTYIRTSDGKKGVFFNGGNNTILFNPEDITWNQKHSNFSTKHPVNGVNVNNNNITGLS